MTNEKKYAIHNLRRAGVSYANTARKLDMPEGTIKTYCRRNMLHLTANKVFVRFIVWGRVISLLLFCLFSR